MVLVILDIYNHSKHFIYILRFTLYEKADNWKYDWKLFYMCYYLELFLKNNLKNNLFTICILLHYCYF